MTATGSNTQDGASREAVAAGWFAGLLTLALGGAGLIIAALAVGAQRAWDNAAGETDRNRERRGAWLDNQRAWLDADHQRRIDRAKANHDWITSGANPTTKPAQPSKGNAWGERARRLWAHTTVGAHDFTAGFKGGWKNADQVRKDGGSFRDVATARPTSNGEANPQPTRTDRFGTQPAGTAEDLSNLARQESDYLDRIADDEARRPFERLVPSRDGLDRCPRCGSYLNAPCRICRTCNARVGLCDNNQHIIQQQQDGTWPDCCTEPIEEDRVDRNILDDAPRTASANTNGGTAMTQTTAAPAAESNATVLRGMLDGIKGDLVRVTESTDALAAIRDHLHTQVERADEFATHTEQSAQSRQALDEARQVVVTLGKYLGDFSQASVGAEDQIGSASDGLRVVEQAEDGLRSVGAGGMAVAPATAA